VTVDGARRHQRIGGFGVNVTPAQWRGGALKPTLDLLVDDLGTSLVRLDCYGKAEDARLVEEKTPTNGSVRIAVPEGSIFTLTTLGTGGR
jgi:hypothetical protein